MMFHLQKPTNQRSIHRKLGCYFQISLLKIFLGEENFAIIYKLHVVFPLCTSEEPVRSLHNG